MPAARSAAARPSCHAPQGERRELLPAVGDHVILPILLLAAAEVQHQPLLADQLDLDGKSGRSWKRVCSLRGNAMELRQLQRASSSRCLPTSSAGTAGAVQHCVEPLQCSDVKPQRHSPLHQRRRRAIESASSSVLGNFPHAATKHTQPGTHTWSHMQPNQSASANTPSQRAAPPPAARPGRQRRSQSRGWPPPPGIQPHSRCSRRRPAADRLGRHAARPARRPVRVGSQTGGLRRISRCRMGGGVGVSGPSAEGSA